jgi:hypothetical protein
MIGQSNFTQQPTAQLQNHIDDQATVLVLTQDGKVYGNKSWDEVKSRFSISEREPA